MERRRTLAAAIASLALGAATAQAAEFGDRLAAAAVERTRHAVAYDPAYVAIAYPGGDVAPDRGVCADVVVRSLRGVGQDLQRLIHEDMIADFAAYPERWGLSRPDPNIDHRRVPNIETFLARRGARLPPSGEAADYAPGDIVAWNLKGDAGDLPHIGIVSGRMGLAGRPLIVHNIGAGPKMEDVLFAWPITGRYRLSETMLAAAGASQ